MVWKCTRFFWKPRSWTLRSDANFSKEAGRDTNWFSANNSSSKQIQQNRSKFRILVAMFSLLISAWHDYCILLFIKNNK